MKCPKCGYLGFETGDRCRNCGYDFSLSTSAATPLDFTLDADPEPLRPALDLDRLIGGPEPAAPLDLPLFKADGHRRTLSNSDTTLVTTPASPRAPLGVRRATPEIPRARPRVSKTPTARNDNLIVRPPIAVLTPRPDASRELPVAAATVAAPTRRILAAVVDISLISIVDATVLYLTLRLCGLTTAEMFELPLLPLGAFFVLLNGGYFVAFTTVGGQSIGKMAAGIKVIGEEDDSVPIGRATVRTLAYLISALPLGAGFLAGMVGDDHLTLHDRLAHTRVVRPSQT
jgi:uncharacterized RDD family membrane protein YckC